MMTTNAILGCGGPYVNHPLEIIGGAALGGGIALIASFLHARAAGQEAGRLLPKALNARLAGIASVVGAMVAPLLAILMLASRGEVVAFPIGTALAFGTAILGGLATVILGNRARVQIAQSATPLAGKAKAGAALITGYTAIFLAVLSGIVVKANLGYRSCGNYCINNLRQIDGAKEQWALEMKKTATDTPTWDDLIGTDKYIKLKPTCHANGVYTIGDMATKPACSVTDHTLQ